MKHVHPITHMLLFYSTVALFFIPALLKAQQAKPAFREHISLQTDRQVYLAGADVWFKAQYSNNLQEQPQLSNVLYIDLIRNSEAIARAKFQIQGRTASGKLTIPQDALSGNYFLRAYTKYQRNFPSTQLYTQMLSVVNLEKAFPEEKNPIAPDSVVIAVEDGNVFPGVANRYAIRTLPEFAARISHAYLATESGQHVQELRLYKNGLSGFSLKRADTAKYSCHFVTRNQDTLRKALPDFPKDRLHISAQPQNNTLQVHLQALNAWKKKHAGEELQVRLYDNHFNLLDQQTTSAAAFPEVMQLSAAHARGHVFAVLSGKTGCLRVQSIVLPAARTLQTEISTGQQVYGNRNAVNVHIAGKNEINWQWLTMAVVRKGTEQPAYALPYEASYSYALLHAALEKRPMSGRIKQQARHALVLLSETFQNPRFCRNFTGHPGFKPSNVPDIREVSLQGKLISRKSQKPLAGKDVFASVFHRKEQIHHQKTDSAGQFIFSLNSLQGNHDVLVSTPVDSLPPRFLINSDFSGNYPETSGIPLRTDTSDAALVQELYLTQQVNRNMQKAVSLQKQQARYEAVNFRGHANYTVDMKDYITLPNMREVVRELIPYVRLRSHKGSYQLHIYSEQSKTWFKHPLVLVDYIPVYDISRLLRMQPQKLERIEVINELYYIGDYVADGILALHTKTDDFGGTKLPRAYTHLRYTGFSPHQQPVFPEHAQPEKNRSLPDFRTTLFWEPHMEAKSDTLTFFTSDRSGAYQIVLTGITESGEKIRQASSFRVKRTAK